MSVVQTVFGPHGEQRIPGVFPASNMTTYELQQPLATHYKELTCQQAECPKFHNGWQMGFDLTDLQKVAAANQLVVIAKKMDKVFSYTQQGTVVIFTFQPGQQCFERHMEPLDRDLVAIGRGGDWRGNPRREKYTHTKLNDWVDDFQNHQDRIVHDLGVE